MILLIAEFRGEVYWRGIIAHDPPRIGDRMRIQGYFYRVSAVSWELARDISGHSEVVIQLEAA